MKRTLGGMLGGLALLGLAAVEGRSPVAGKPADEPASLEANRPKLFLALPDYCNTPDGMTLDEKTGDVILACPNFNILTEDGTRPKYPGVLMKIDKQNRASLYFPMPVHPKTGLAGPMGLDIGPDGNLYVADNQYFYDKNRASRLIRVVRKDGVPIAGETAVDGFGLANAVIWKDNAVYVSDTFLDIPGKPGTSGIYRIMLEEMKQGTVHLKPGLDDPHLIATFTTVPNQRNDLAGADGLTFDSRGNLYCGNFGDGVISKIAFNADGSIKENKVLIRSDKIQCADGMFSDLATDRIYVTNSQDNGIHVFTPDGRWSTLWMNGDTDGSDGLLDQPCEVLLRGDELLIVCFDMPFPGLKNSEFDAWHTISVIRLKR